MGMPNPRRRALTAEEIRQRQYNATYNSAILKSANRAFVADMRAIIDEVLNNEPEYPVNRDEFRASYEGE